MNGYYDTDMALKQARQLHTFTIRAKVNTNNIIDVVSKRQELRLVRNYHRLQKQYLISLYGMCCCVRHRKSKRVKEMLSPNNSFICSP